MKLTALIPVYNEDYALRYCLASIVDHFDEIIVFDDASTDYTADVVAWFTTRYPHVSYRLNRGRQLGWIEARNRLAALTESSHLFWLDSDDVLCEYNAHMLRWVAEGPKPVVRLQLCEMWGDFYHTTQRLRHYDRCHTYVNRRVFRDMTWTGGTCARVECATAGSSSRAVVAVNGPGPLLFHIKGVKPDRRLAERVLMRGYLGDKAKHKSVAAFGRLDELSQEQIHDMALRHLLRIRQDKLRPTYHESPVDPKAPRRPEVIERDLPGRFAILYKDGVPIDRVDHERSLR